MQTTISKLEKEERAPQNVLKYAKPKRQGTEKETKKCYELTKQFKN